MYKVAQINETEPDIKNYMDFIDDQGYVASTVNINFSGEEGSSSLKVSNPILINENNNFNNQETYYFQGSIRKRASKPQEFLIYLADCRNKTINSKQYIKKIKIYPGEGFTNLEFTFKPDISSYNTILFEFQRQPEDLIPINGNLIFEPVIIYKELSIVKIIKLSSDSITNGLVKFGIRTRPGTLMVLDGEEIRVGQTGVYELKNKIIRVKNISIVNGAIFNSEGESEITSSISYIGKKEPIKRYIEPFTLDYIYE